ncbi:peptidase [Nitrincola sp. A-D6]|uniref:L,D-transpeptidase n=1 Tax=Nitrincola sp. A-D6 TaxID=1545442 RepID=UPI00051FB048|nr:L,D-transpeptidase [Nitrincola sp. A-D6]KGK41581.1 peptidase [Nitrincola sp. A-D6]
MSASTLHISIAAQQLSLLVQGKPVRHYRVSTAKNGAGNTENSGCTPLGLHYVRAKIGAGLPVNSVFVGRRFTGEYYTSSLASRYPQRDWILTRILWLCGLEPGFNRLGQVDSMRRFIYIHGTPDTEPMGIPLSHGCVRMRNADILELFELIQAGCRVSITAE